MSFLTIDAFCTSPGEPTEDECHDRSRSMDPTDQPWVYATGWVIWDNVLYSFNGAEPVWGDGVADELLALPPGCHELDIAEDGVSTHWSDPYEFCLTSAPANSSDSGQASADEVSFLTIDAFCTSPDEPTEDECDYRSQSIDRAERLWVFADGVMNWDTVLYRFNRTEPVWGEGVADALLALPPGCHELDIAEDGVSTHWSDPYEFCLADPGETASVPTTPTGLRLAANTPGELRLSWNAVEGATLLRHLPPRG